MTPLLIGLYVVAVSISIGVLVAAVAKTRFGWIETFSIGFGSVLLGGLIFYERSVFQHYAFLLAVFPVALVVWRFCSAESAGWLPSDSMVGEKHPSSAVVGLVALFLVTLLTRLPVSNFLFEIGDAGSYVNSANSLAETGKSAAQFFPLNQILLGLFSSLGGFEATPYGVVFAGFLSLVYAYLFGTSLFEDRRCGVLVAFMVSFNILAMWFARVPYSETLMLTVNLGALAFFMSASKGESPRLNYILFGLFVALACANRVTGIVWMFLLMSVAVVAAFQSREKLRQLVPGAAVAVSGYITSIYVALQVGPGYYMNWQIKKFIPFVDSRKDLLVFHVAWLVLAVALVLLSQHKSSALRKGWEWLARHSAAVTTVLLVVMLPLAVFFVSRGKVVLGDAFLAELSGGQYPQDVYFLWNYFTPVSLLLFPLGLVWLVRRMNPFLRPHTLAAWLFALLFLVIHYVRVVYEKPHDVYLYWDRYFLSETFIVFVIVLASGLLALWQWKWLRAAVIVFLAGYFVYGAIWLAPNRNASYLDGAEEMFAWIQRVVPRKGTTVFLDEDYDGRWLFPNLRRSIMSPLSRSFDYNVNLGPRGAQPFTSDVPLTAEITESAFAKRRDVFIIRALKYKRGDVYALPGVRDVQLVAEEVFSIKVKTHSPGRIFTPKYKEYPLYLAVYRAHDNAILPGEVSTSGFHSDMMWTSGDGHLSGFERCSEKGFEALTIWTGGNHPWWEELERIQVAVAVNGVPSQGEWLSPKQYRVALERPVTCITDISVSSSTFVPAELGINADVRELGLDIIRLKPEE